MLHTALGCAQTFSFVAVLGELVFPEFRAAFGRIGFLAGRGSMDILFGKRAQTHLFHFDTGYLLLDADLRAVNATWAHEVVARSFFDPAAHQRRLTACPDAAALRRAAVPPLGVLAARGAWPAWDGYLDAVYNDSVAYPFDLDALEWLYDFSPLGALRPVTALPRCAVLDEIILLDEPEQSDAQFLPVQGLRTHQYQTSSEHC